MCREDDKHKVEKCLEYNPVLLNCLEGKPLLAAVKGQNLQVLDTLMKKKGLKVNLKSEFSSLFTFLKLLKLDEHGLSVLHFGTSLDNGAIIRRLLRHPDIEANPVSKKGQTPIIMATTKGKLNALEVLTYLPLLTHHKRLFRLFWKIA